ncbi:major facilitator superfamily (MFS) transport protein [Francisella sp. W12-1067]|nr:major facilitator superfamily (MFS) transport protein [Francisella sp. W12-1067]
MLKEKVKTLGLSIWFICAFFYALEYFIRSSSGALYHSFSISPYNMSAQDISLSSSAFYLTYVIAQLPAGLLVDKFGIKRIMIVSTLIFSVSIFIATVATSLNGIIIYRSLAGLGGGFAFLCAFKSISLWLPPRLFPLFTGLTQFFLYFGAMLSAAPLVVLSKYFNISMIMSGVFLVSIIIFLLSIFIIKTHPEFSKNILFKGQQTKSLTSLMEVLQNKQIWLNGIYCFTIYGTTVLFADLWGIKYLKLLGFSQYNAGICTSLIFIGVAIFSPIWGMIATLLDGERKPLIIAPFLGIFIVILLLYINTNVYIVFVLCLLFGGVQAVHVLNFSALRNTVTITRIATALALVNLFLPLSGGVLQPLTGEIINYISQSHHELFAFKVTMLAIPILMFFSFIIGFFIKDSRS